MVGSRGGDHLAVTHFVVSTSNSCALDRRLMLTGYYSDLVDKGKCLYFSFECLFYYYFISVYVSSFICLYFIHLSWGLCVFVSILPVDSRSDFVLSSVEHASHAKKTSWFKACKDRGWHCQEGKHDGSLSQLYIHITASEVKAATLAKWEWGGKGGTLMTLGYSVCSQWGRGKCCRKWKWCDLGLSWGFWRTVHADQL